MTSHHCSILAPNDLSDETGGASLQACNGSRSNEEAVCSEELAHRSQSINDTDQCDITIHLISEDFKQEVKDEVFEYESLYSESKQDIATSVTHDVSSEVCASSQLMEQVCCGEESTHLGLSVRDADMFEFALLKKDEDVKLEVTSTLCDLNIETELNECNSLLTSIKVENDPLMYENIGNWKVS